MIINTDEIPLLDEHTAAHVAELFRAFSDTNRVRLLSVLVKGDCNVSTLAEKVGISPSAVSHHLRSLRQMRLIVSRRDGKEVFYRLEDTHIRTLFEQGVSHILKG
jgi:ArsR family transcriptional regulator, lead/cadmium/zinc/bismuth-responsive transcriptional repressor